MKKLFAVLLATVIFLCGMAAIAENAGDSQYIQVTPESSSVQADGGLTNSEAAAGYIRNALKQPEVGNGISFPRKNAVGTQLTGNARKLYDLMRPYMVQAAAGKVSSTTFSFPASEFAENVTYTREELGYGSRSDNEGIANAFLEKIGFPGTNEISKVLDALLADMPYEMYWFDKTTRMYPKYDKCGCVIDGEGNVGFSTYDDAALVMPMPVAEEYSQTGAVGTFQLKTSLGQAVTDAAANIRTILSDNKSKSDYDKLKAYRDWIYNHVEYNIPASEDKTMPYGNPWQLVWVFDNDDSTKVVCEGYSKAFKYLCDATAFQGSVSAICVTGVMSGGTGSGDHMWNVVTMNNGYRYLVDVTNDHDGSLFLAGYTDTIEQENGSVAYKYGSLLYMYDSDLTNLFKAEELETRQNENYTAGTDPTESAWKEPTYTWASDYSSVTGALESETNQYATVLETVLAEKTAVVDATCETAEMTTYASVAGSFVNAAFKDQTITVETAEALGHDWGDPVYTWSEDNKTLTATRVCKRDESHTETETVQVTSAVAKDPTCTEMGDTLYTSAAFANAAFAVQTKTETDIPALGHDWAAPTYGWNEDNTEVTATRVCKRDETHVETEAAQVSAEVTVKPTCTEMGDTTYTGAAYINEAFTVQTKTETDIPALGHDWDAATYTWNEDHTKVTALHVCKRDDSHTETETAEAVAEVTKPATCTDKGETTYTGKAFRNAAFAVQTETLVNIEALGHDWAEPTYGWNEGNTEVTATRVCKRDETHVETEAAKVSAEVTVKPTCTEMGDTTYTGAAYTNEAFKAQTKTETDIPALGHDWDAAAYTWNDDHTKVTAAHICKRDHTHTETETVEATAEVTKPATCTDKGETTYTGKAFRNAAFAVQTETLVNIEALGHDWAEPTYGWNEDNTEVTATRICNHDKTHVETETVKATAAEAKAPTCTEMGDTTYTGAAYTNEAFKAQTKTETNIPALGHDWAEATYTWNEDHTKVTAERVCKRDKAHTETETAEATAEITKAATCTDKGETTYTGKAFTNPAFAVQTETLVNVEALDHDWSEITYTWSEDNTEVTASRICNRDKTHAETETVKATAEVTKQATCTETGETTYTGKAFANPAFAVQTETLVNVEPLGHDWDEGVVVKEATAAEDGIRRYTCLRCDATEDEPFSADEAAVDVQTGGGWAQKENGAWTYLNEAGQAVTGMQRIGKALYCFNQQGEMVTGWIGHEGDWYYAQPSGVLYTGGWQKIGETRYYFRADGKMVTGWFLQDGKWYYLGENGVMVTGWLNANGTWYLMNDSGEMQTGWVQDNGKWYYFDVSGAMRTGWLLAGGTWYLLKPNGELATGWAQDGGHWYYFEPSGAMRTGWVRSGDAWYLMNASGAMATGWAQSGGAWYYMNASGTMRTGWLQSGGDWYLLRPSGEMATGWAQDGGSWYYFNASGAMRTGWLQSGGAKYLLKSSGAMATGWTEHGENWYYFNASGVMKTGWFEDKEAEAALPEGGKRALWYWFDENGIMAKGWKEIAGRWEMFADNGEWLYTWDGN